MKTLYLMRHAEPLRLFDIPQKEWPLSEKGHELAMRFFSRQDLAVVKQVFSSPLLRAVQTAKISGLPLTIDRRLEERHAGKAAPEFGDCWLRQYEDGAFKCPDGESFDEVGQRMEACFVDILAALKVGEAAVVVSHAAAICAFLKQYCVIRVTERASKTRETLWCGKQVYIGNLPPLMCFRMEFNQSKLENIEALLF